MKKSAGNRCISTMFLAGTILAAIVGIVRAQTTPGLAIARNGTNGLSITVTNAVLTDSYELWWTPNLGDAVDYPWTLAAPGAIGQTNFLFANWGYPAVFFRGVLDTNNPPLWENASPNSPGTNLLKITIASPANGALLQ